MQNWIGGFKIYDAKFVPPPANKVIDCMNDLQACLTDRVSAIRFINQIITKVRLYKVNQLLSVKLTHTDKTFLTIFLIPSGTKVIILLGRRLRNLLLKGTETTGPCNT